MIEMITIMKEEECWNLLSKIFRVFLEEEGEFLNKRQLCDMYNILLLKHYFYKLENKNTKISQQIMRLNQGLELFQISKAYFSFNKMIQNSQQRKKQLRKPISSNFSARRLAINFQPPTIILQYLVLQTGKLYHHKMRLDSILRQPNSNRIDLLNYLKNKHYLYFNSKLKDEQLLKFIDILLSKNKKKQKNEINGQNKKEMSPIKSQFNQLGDFNYLSDDDYQQDYEDFQQNSDTNQIAIQQKVLSFSPNRGNSFNKDTFLSSCQDYEGQKDDLESVQWNLPSEQDADFI